ALEFVDNDDVAGVLVGGQAVGQPYRQLCRFDLNAGLGLDEQLDVLLADVRSDADHGAILDSRMLGSDVLDLECRDVLAFDADVVRHAPVEIHVPRGIERSDIAGVEAVRPHSPRGRVGVLVVADRQRTGYTRANDDLSPLPPGNGRPIVVQKIDVEPRQWPAY